MEEVEGGILAASGFSASTVSCGIKAPKGTRKDILLIDAGTAVAAAAVFTTNRVQAAPVLVSKEHIRTGLARALVINSGNANACNGQKGMEDARAMAAETASGLGIPAEMVLVASTGVIGRPMPMDCIREGIREAVGLIGKGEGTDAARAIMTTDTVPKECSVRFDMDGVTVSIGGIAKGAGMICPNMATMISLITTDAAIAPGMLNKALRHAVGKSFNCITVDGDMSTNDTVFVLANAKAGNSIVTSADSSGYKAFETALTHVCTTLAKKIARDGEGATKFVEIVVKGARSDTDARVIGLSVANSALVKTAIYGKDPNWGRILCAVGYADAPSDPDTIDLFLCGHPLTRNGMGLPLDEPLMRKALEANEIPIVIDLNMGDGTATIWTCDLSHEYVTVNAEYTT
ncbi:MAG: bifunctional glutamate N-acetyltransferase/amino-acid acetyltransferase ArgJ [candidate division Zixibacteria bacterium]|nr:bifunctional glutamate N-acetyltransferase/amino-acid acetyltransferase ArgJ [candidate division Zixibacteria bacterium]